MTGPATVLGVCLLLLAGSIAAAQTVERVARVIDGDVLLMVSGERVRLDDVTVPNAAPNCPCRRDCEAAVAARRMVAEMVQGGVVIERYGQDRQRQTLARVRTPDGRSLSAALSNADLARRSRADEPAPSWCS